MAQFNYNSDLVQSNMEEVLDMSTFSIYDEAKQWYPKAGAIARSYAEKYYAKFRTVCALISVFSPQKAWHHNLILTENYLKNGKAGHTKTQVEKARMILNRTTENIDDVLGGNKTINFYHNIYNPKDDRYCTIDGHMIQLMTGQMDKLNLSTKQYNFLKGELITFSKKNKRLPSEMQATLWLIFRQNKKEKLGGKLII